MERKRKEKEEKVSFGDTFKPHPPVLDKDRLMKLRLDYFHLRNRKLKPLFQASIIDVIDSSSKPFTLNCKQTLLDTEPFLLAL